MAIPFRGAEEIARLGGAGYLRFLSEGAPGAFRGGLLLVNARSEPLEFAHARIRLPRTGLWREADRAPYAARRLAASLFEVCPRAPALLLCLAGETGAELFTRDLALAIPTARVAAAGAVPGEGEDAEDTRCGVRLLWAGRRPGVEAPARRLLERLAERGLLAEPLDRAAAGLDEVYGPAGRGGDDDRALVERAAGR
ncbi:MAG TPA: hypothetical protein VE913_03190 [Longimicrobium sp.]|nr:hypothetical protein [Longimicrobium sp.]